jgi:hypothetical protein
MARNLSDFAGFGAMSESQSLSAFTVLSQIEYHQKPQRDFARPGPAGTRVSAART